MLRVALPTNSILSHAESGLEGVLQSQMVLTPQPVHAEVPRVSLGSNDLSSLGKTAIVSSIIQSRALDTPSTVIGCDNIKLPATNSPNANSTQDEASSSLVPAVESILDNTILPIKNQITFRKAYMVLALLILLRVFNLGFLPSEAFQTSFPFLPLDYAGPHATSNPHHIPEDTHFEELLKSDSFTPLSLASVARATAVSVIRGFTLMFLDFYELHKFILTSPAVLVVLLFAFFFHPLASWLDEKIHREFYDSVAHKNIHQMPPWASNLGKKGFKYLRYLIIAMAIWPMGDALSREANLVLVICTVWMSVFKRVLKNIVNVLHIKPALRPPNQAFPRGLYFGGFPSGHVSQAFVAVVAVYHVWGLNNLMGVALVAQTIFTTIWVISANRHYISQVSAGLALGAIYGVAAISWLQRIHGPNTFHAGAGLGWDLL